MASEHARRSLNALPPGTVLRDYVIESELGSGGFSIVYLARHHLKSDWLYAIKEFLPAELATRAPDGTGVRLLKAESRVAFEDGLRRFRDEAGQLRKFRNERYIVSCVNYFEENNTAYLVMDYDDGLPLSEFLERRETAGQPFTEADMRAVVESLLEDLAVVHRAGVLHRDIKPGNIFVRRQDDIIGRPAHPVLIDFGAAKQNYLEKHSRSRAPYTPGYAAYEQISSEGDIGPWTDIYAVGALMWRMVAGGCPGDSRLLVSGKADGESVWNPTPRAAEMRGYAVHQGKSDPMTPAAELGAGRFSPEVLNAIDRCVTLYPEDRPQNCGDLRALLNTSVRPKSTVPDSHSEQTITDALNAGIEACNRSEYAFALREFRRLATLGHAEAQYLLGSMYYRGEGVPEDDAQAVQWFTLAAEQGHAEAQCELGVIYYFGEGVPEDHRRAVQWFSLAAEQGEQATPAAQHYRAAVQGDAEAQWKLGSMYSWGDPGAPRDHAQAVHWYSLAAAEGHDTARQYMAEVQAVERYTHAAEQGDAEAQYELGSKYEIGGEGTPIDPTHAAQWFIRTAEQGHEGARLKLGEMYCTGWGVEEDHMQAAHWYTRAAEQGNAVAQFKLGDMYRKGDGVSEDPAQAIQWFIRAAEQGAPHAQYSLGSMYKSGAGVRANNVQAYAWTNLAVGRLRRFSLCGRAPESIRRRNDPAAILRDEIAAKLSGAQLAEAQQLSIELDARIQRSR